MRLSGAAPGDRAAVAALLAWMAATGLAALIRPGELLEMSLIGAVVIVAWGLADAESLTPRLRWLSVLALALPLTNTWPARALVAALTNVPAVVQTLLSPSTVLIAAFLVLVPWRSPLARASLPYVAAGGLLAAAGIISSAFAAEPWDALRATLHTHALPVAIGIAAACFVRRARDGWALVQPAAIAAAIPALVGAAAYTLSFGVPLSGSDLVATKVALVRPFLFQEVTFGNVGHLADLALLLLPAAALAVVREQTPRWINVASGLAAAGLLSALVLTASRGALAVAAIELLTLTALLAARRTRAAVVPAAGLAVLALVAFSPAVRSSYVALKPSLAFESISPESAERVDVGPVVVTVGDASAVERIDALRIGFRVARDHLPFGVGTGQYRDFDSVYTAPHSLAVQILAENGVAGLIALAGIGVLLFTQAIRIARRVRTTELDSFLLAAACVVGPLGLLLHGVLVGAPLAVGQVNVWAALLWLQAGVLAGLASSDARAE